MILLEGIDRSGKSTVINNLIRSQVSTLFKLYNKPANNSYYERERVRIAYNELFHQAELNNASSTVIFDRSYPSEIVYSIRRDYDAFWDSFWWELEDTLKGRAVIVYCFVDPDELVKRFTTTRESHLRLEEIPQILDRYNLFLDRTRLPVLRLETTERPQDLADKVIQFHNEHSRCRD